MDEATRSGLSLGKILVVAVLTLIFALSMGVYVASQKIKTLPNPKSCFTTPWNQVHLCPQSANYAAYKKIPDLFIRALILSEDASFFSHQGFDWFEIKESVRKNWQEKRYVRGASTLSQQLAKNLYLSNEKTLWRKLNEVIIARHLEQNLEKWEILEKYLNVIEFGPDIFGISQAAQYHFQKNYQNLNLLEIVYLVAIIPNPKKLGEGTLDKNRSETVTRRMHRILRLLYKTQRISEQEWVYSQTLMDTEPWPFDLFDPGHYNYMEIPNVSAELEGELETIEEETEVDGYNSDLEAEIQEQERQKQEDEAL